MRQVEAKKSTQSFYDNFNITKGDLITIHNDVNDPYLNCIGYEVYNEMTRDLFYLSCEEYENLKIE